MAKKRTLRPPHTDPFHRRGHQWRLVRLRVLERDGWSCQIRGEGCLGRADTVDHIVPRAHGGPLLDPANLRAACHVCNSARRVAWRPPSATGPSREW